MKIVVFGATGRTGAEIVRQALAAGHEVTAFVRNPAKLGIEARHLIVLQGDVLDPAAVEKAVAGQEAVVSALGPTRPPVPGMLAAAAKNILAAMQKAGLRRLVSITGAGVRDPHDQPGLMDHVMQGLLSLLASDILKASAAGVEVIQGSDLDWTIVRFPRLMNGNHTQKYRVGFIGKGSGSQLSRADAADFVLRELVEKKYVHQMPVASY
jgi:putative NADH-flavin reductase